MTELFIPGNILVPQTDLTRWAVIACDQFTSQPDYWARVEQAVGDAPSALRMMLPEAYLGKPNAAAVQAGIPGVMASYLESGVFREIRDSYIYVERTLSGGGLRRGLLGLIDLEAYDYSPDSASPIRATEGMVANRLPARVALRRDAPLETPHLVVFFDDPSGSISDGWARRAGELLYDFPLMEGGGHIRGFRLHGESAAATKADLVRLSDPRLLGRKYHCSEAPVIMAVGDGNHSLAAAKQHWENVRSALSPAEREAHPARFALAELVNLHEDSIDFEPINRVLFRTDTGRFLDEARAYFAPWADEGHEFRCVCATGGVTLRVGGTIGESIACCERFIEDYAARWGGDLDYIHGSETVEHLCEKPGRAGIVMPELHKRDLFPSIIRSGALPKKSFSIGPALDKRYYLECRRILQ